MTTINLNDLPAAVRDYLLQNADVCAHDGVGNEICGNDNSFGDGYITTDEVILALDVKAITNTFLQGFGLWANPDTGEIQTQTVLKPNGLAPHIAPATPKALSFNFSPLQEMASVISGTTCPTPQQTRRLEQLFLIGQVAIAIARSYTPGQAGTLGGEFWQNWRDAWGASSQQDIIDSLIRLATQIIPAMGAEILANPNLTVETAFTNHRARSFLDNLQQQEENHPILATLGCVENISFIDTYSDADLNSQRLATMSFCRRLGYADQALRVALRMFDPEISSYMSEHPDLTEPLHTLARTAESLTHDGLAAIDAQEMLLKAEVLFQHIDRSKFDAQQNDMFDSLMDAIDPYGEWFNLADTTKKSIAKSFLLVTAAGGVAHAATAGIVFLGGRLAGQAALAAGTFKVEVHHYVIF
ncbi:hypothetical protein K1X76_12855 [bacterium]|nr:hypothetical protein [bacterium]